jgi:hypothetical protein
MRAGVIFAESMGEKVETMSYASKILSSAEGRLFNQIAMFSIVGLSTSMAMVIMGGLRVVYPWY